MDIYLPSEVGDNLYPPLIDTTSIKLKPLQTPVFNNVKNKKSALILAKTSFGKSVVLVALHEVWQGKTLVLSHNLENVKYLQNQFKDFIGVKAGAICTGQKEMRDVTITTYASFKSKLKDFAEYGFDNLIIDEADVAFTDKMRLAISRFSFSRLLGLTGTDETVYDLCKPNEVVEPEERALRKFYQYTFVADYDETKNPLEKIYYRQYKKTYKDKDGVIAPNQWHKYREVLDTDIDRKKAMLQYIQDTSTDEEYSLVLFDRIADVEVFYKSAKNRNIKCFMNYGSQDKKERVDHMEKFQKGGGIMFAQYKTISRGWDCPPLTKVYIFLPMKSKTNILQITGRAMRWLEGKKSYIYLWADSSLYHQFKAIKEVYRKEFKKELHIC